MVQYPRRTQPPNLRLLMPGVLWAALSGVVSGLSQLSNRGVNGRAGALASTTAMVTAMLLVPYDEEMDPVRFSPSESTPRQVGDPAPDFNLRHTFERSVSRTQGRPMVVAFYVFDFGAF